MTVSLSDPSTQWLSSEEAARRLGVKIGTLYSYVSRGLVRSFPSPDDRSSRFDRTDIESLLTRRRSHPGGAADAVVASRITQLGEDGVTYRGWPVEQLASSRTFEEVAALLWDCVADGEPWVPQELPMPMPVAGDDTTLADLLRIAIVLAATTDLHRHDLRQPSVVMSARRLVATCVASLPVTAATSPVLTVRGQRHPGSVAAALAARLGAPKVSGGLVQAVNTALVLLADHELATSTYAARVAASTRADVYSTVLAGASCSGPLHVGASRDVARLLRDAADRGAGVAVGDLLRWRRFVPGFGHKIYRRDPRFALLFDAAVSSGFPRRRVALVHEVLALASERVPVEPNVDFAGAALAFCAGLRDDAAEAIFLVARMAGWVAHTLEEYGEEPLRFRTRGLYVGEPRRR
ncbi:MAG: citrate/2-methylcitrate synthase [Acidimicrobiia bacterium]